MSTADLTSNEHNLWRFGVPKKKDSSGTEPAPVRATVQFNRLMLSSPLSAGVLQAAGLGQVVKRARTKETGFNLVALDLTNCQEQELFQLAEQVEPPTEWPAMWNIPPGSVVKRAEFHEVYGGNRLVTVTSSAKTPNAFLFLKSNQAGDLAPAWDGSLLTAPGYGHWRDEPSLENLAVLAHQRRGVPLRVFLAQGSECLYIGEFAVESRQPIEGSIVTGEWQNSFDPRLVHEIRTPIFRLRQLNGVPPVVRGGEAFKGAPRMNLRLRPSSDQPADALVSGLLEVLERQPGIAASLGELDEVQLLTGIVQRTRRQADLDELRAAVEEMNTKEQGLQKIIERMTWVFGGEFIPGTARRNLTARDQLDLALLRPDGTLHGVELKKANEKLVGGHRGHRIPSSKVHKAVCQATNYLRELDEKRPQILADWGIDCRRASMTVVIGHKSFVPADVTEKEVHETIRTYNSDHSRVTVTTYDQLIENAQRVLDLTAPLR
ncbi:Shedu anti-phage system protein SduA domain-containing protein [Streptomyces sp. 8N114]|uniref:Shedu anti-phage system protein SduA domain-containing protein n=1 Tax=Streptomyces sp. 8N114 TaxID=3457419 RepID=UPI003FD038BF